MQLSGLNETSAGVFKLTATVISTGTVQLRIPTTATITDVAGNSLNVSSAIDDAETIAGDTTAPVGDLAQSYVNSDKVVLQYSDLSSLDSGNAPAASTFAVTSNGVAATVSSLAIFLSVYL